MTTFLPSIFRTTHYHSHLIYRQKTSGFSDSRPLTTKSFHITPVHFLKLLYWSSAKDIFFQCNMNISETQSFEAGSSPQKPFCCYYSFVHIYLVNAVQDV